MDAFKTIAHASEEEFVINRSRFIGRCFPIKTEEEALAHLAAIRKQHYDATHNCYAYRVGTRGETARFSDDGEPSGTAGMPALEVLKREGLTGLCVVVTRYFGGILLGAGGLVRAYARSAKAAIDAAGICEFVPFTELEAVLEYSDYQRFLRDMPKLGVKCDSSEFGSDVTLRLAIERERLSVLTDYLVDSTDGRAVYEVCGERYDGKPEKGITQ